MTIEVSMALAHPLFQRARDGNKNVTIRRGYRPVRLGDFYFYNASDNDDILECEVVRVTHCVLWRAGLEVLQADGFKDLYDAVKSMREFYPDLTEHSEVTVIHWEL